MKKKLIIDIIMTILLILLMKIGILNIDLHELIGLVTFVLFILHKVLNYKIIVQTLKNWNKLLLKNKLNFILDIVILLVFVFLMISSVIISNNIFKFLNISSALLWSDLHHFSSYLLLILISIHTGFHYNTIWIFIKNKLKIKDNKFMKYSYILISIIFIIFGVKVILNNSFYKHLLKPFGYKEKTKVEEKVTTNKITLYEYLKDKHCDGCSRHCFLTSLRCSNGQYYLQRAKDEYNNMYSVTTKENIVINVELDPFDYILVMSSIVASTHYILKSKKIKTN